MHHLRPARVWPRRGDVGQHRVDRGQVDALLGGGGEVLRLVDRGDHATCSAVIVAAAQRGGDGRQVLQRPAVAHQRARQRRRQPQVPAQPGCIDSARRARRPACSSASRTVRASSASSRFCARTSSAVRSSTCGATIDVRSSAASASRADCSSPASLPRSITCSKNIAVGGRSTIRIPRSEACPQIVAGLLREGRAETREHGRGSEPSLVGSVAGVKKVAVLDYGSGNLRSAERALERVGADVTVTSDPQVALDADGLVVPGVGAFAACMAGLRAVDGPRIIGRRLAGGRPVLGICVGMQILFDRGVEHGHDAEGCGEWPGVVEQLKAPVLPHMGWNTVEAPDGQRAVRRARRRALLLRALLRRPRLPARRRRAAEPAAPSRWSPGPSTATASSPVWRTGRCRRPSSTRRRAGTPARSCSPTGCRRSTDLRRAARIAAARSPRVTPSFPGVLRRPTCQPSGPPAARTPDARPTVPASSVVRSCCSGLAVWSVAALQPPDPAPADAPASGVQRRPRVRARASRSRPRHTSPAAPRTPGSSRASSARSPTWASTPGCRTRSAPARTARARPAWRACATSSRCCPAPTRPAGCSSPHTTTPWRPGPAPPTTPRAWRPSWRRCGR